LGSRLKDAVEVAVALVHLPLPATRTPLAAVAAVCVTQTEASTLRGYTVGTEKGKNKKKEFIFPKRKMSV